MQEPLNQTWQAIEANKPQLLLLLGDNIYLEEGEFGNVPKIEAKYQRLLLSEPFRRLYDSGRILATWDDHDFGENNSDSDYKFRPQSYAAFKKMWTHNPAPPKGLPDSLAFRKDFKGIRILVPDVRSFRRIPGKEGAGMFGKEQLQWLRQEIAGAGNKIVVFASGTQVLSDRDDSEALRSYPEEFKALIEALEQRKSPSIILSGDRHYAELLQSRTPNDVVLFEATSSPIAAEFRRPSDIGTESERIALVAEKRNFGLLHIPEKGEKGAIRVEIRGEHNEVLAAAEPFEEKK